MPPLRLLRAAVSLQRNFSACLASLRKPRGVLSKARPRRPPAPPAFQFGQTSIQVECRACVCTFAGEFGQASQRAVRVGCARPMADFTGGGYGPAVSTWLLLPAITLAVEDAPRIPRPTAIRELWPH